MYVGETEIAAGVAISEARVVEAHELQDRGVKIVDVDRLIYGPEAELVRRAVYVTALHAAAGHPHRESVVVVVATVELARVLSRRGQFDGGRAAELAAPKDERFVQHAALLQVLQQCADRAVALPGEGLMHRFQVVVIVPRLTGPVPHLHKAHAALHEPPGDEDLPRLRAGTVAIEHVLWFAADVERLRGRRLHAKGQFERLDAGVQLRVVDRGLPGAAG